MGYAVQRFVGTVDSNLICGICSSVLEDAVLTPCGHSFCLLCLETWLSRPTVGTCPECRAKVTCSEAKPIISLRNLIKSYNIECDNKERGCKVMIQLDRLDNHQSLCGFHLVECAGCNGKIIRCELANHQMQCEGIAATVREDAVVSRGCERSPRVIASAVEIGDFIFKIGSMELQLKKMKCDLQIAESKNKLLEKEFKKSKDELAKKRSEIVNLQYNEFDPDYDYGYTPGSIAQLSLLVCKYLMKKPTYVDKNKVFQSIRRCYEHYSRCGDEFEHDVHMLLATCYASNWFTEAQRVNFHCWLESIARYRQFVHNLSV